MEKNGKFQCPCCDFYTLGEEGAFDVCPVCFWEDDKSQCRDIDLIGGANKISLAQARENFRSFGASAEEFLPFVREPLEDEQ